MIPVTLKNVTMSRAGFVVLLEHEESGRILPIHIGTPEAQAILFAQRGIPIPRPMTHDLMVNIVRILGGRLEKVTIHDLREHTFYAALSLKVKGKVLQVDARPSDSIALALRMKAPLFVAPAVMAQAGLTAAQIEDADDTGGTRATKASRPPAEPLDPISMLQHSLDLAIKEERYEDAARIRDEIQEKVISERNPHED